MLNDIVNEIDDQDFAKRRLFRTVIAQVFSDAFLTARDHESVVARANARDWLKNILDTPGFEDHLNTLCWLAGLNPEAVKTSARKSIAKIEIMEDLCIN